MTVRFLPWIGSDYESGIMGVRVLVTCESHYGSTQYERPMVTAEIIKALALGQKHPLAAKRLRRHPHFTKIMTSIVHASHSISPAPLERRAFWSKVAYCNFLQSFMKAPRDRPNEKAWTNGEEAFTRILTVLQPNLIVCYSIRNGQRVRKLAGTVPVAVVNHPSSRFAYLKVNPVIAAQFAAAKAIEKAEFADCATFRAWRLSSDAAQPARGAHLSEGEKPALLAHWADLMATIDAT